MEIKKTIEIEFTECDTCKAKPGMPTLCNGCLKNRQVISTVNDLLSKTTASQMGKKGGLARKNNLTEKRRKEIATKAAKARWGKKKIAIIKNG